MGLYGDAAMKARPGVQKRIEELRKEAMNGLFTGKSQLEFDSASRRLQSITYEQMGRHYESQAHVWGASVQQGAMVEDQRRAANTFNDPEGLKHILADQDGLATKLSQHTGKDPLGLAAEAKSKIVVSAIDGAIARRDFGTAQQIFDAHSTYLDPGVRATMAGHLAAQTDKAEREAEKARDGAIVDGIFGGAVPGTTGPRRRGSGATGASGDLWSRIKGAEGGLGRGGEALVSPKGAIGISQIIPSTARTVAADLGLPYDERRLHTDQAYNEKLGSHYLDQQMEKYDGNEALAAAAYNAGPHRVDEWLHTIGDPRTGAITDAQFAEKIPFGETRAYVKKIIAGTPREGAPTPLYTPGTLAPGTDAGTAAERFAAGAARPTGAGAAGIVPAGAQAGTHAPAPAAAAPARFDRAAGDSIAAQQIRHGVAGSEADFKTGTDLPGTARVGAHPSEVLRRINDEVAADPKAFAGVNFLSSGASNNPDDAGFVGDQIDALKKGGATAVVVPGVGPGVKNAAAVNASLKSVVEEHGGTFFQPQIKWQPDGVHPAEVDKVRDQGLAALRKAGPQAAAGGAPAAQVTPPAFDTAHADGMVKPGNLDPWNRPVLKNPDGGYSTTSSMSIGTDDGEVLIPTVVDGKRLSNDDAIAHFKATGENLGTFSTPAAADAYATALHDAQASMYDAKGNPKTPAPPDQLQGKPAPSPMTAPVPYLPTREEMIARIPEGLSEEGYNRVLAKVNQRYSHMLQATSADRAQALAQYKGGLVMLQDGREFSYDPNTYRHLFPKENADQMIGDLEDAHTIGQQVQTVRGMPIDDILKQRAANQEVLAHSTGAGYARQKHLATEFIKASNTAIADRIFSSAQGFPSKEELLAKIPEGLSEDDRNHVITQLNQRYSHQVEATGADRQEMLAQYKGGLAMLQDGREFAYDPAKIRSLFPANTADEMVANLDDAARIGRDMTELRGLSLTDIATRRAENEATLNQHLGPDYERYSKRAKAFDVAAEKHIKALGEDPAAYVEATNPEILRARDASASETPEQSAALRAQGVPDAVESFAAKLLGEQERLQVPPEMRHVLSKTQAEAAARQIIADPEHAPAMLKTLQQRWGSAWPEVWADITRVGKLPAAYQMVGALEDEGDGALMARGLAEANKEGVNGSLDKLLDTKVAGALKPSVVIATRIAGDENINQYKRSMVNSGASQTQVEGIISAIGLLAKAKVLYHNEDPATAADHAVESAIGKWEFMPNGGARVPRANFDAITDNARAAVEKLNLPGLQLPARFAPMSPNDSAPTSPGIPGSAQPDDWLRILKASPNWVTVGQSIRLIDNGGRFVRRGGGGFVEVPFDAKPLATAPIAPAEAWRVPY